MSFLGRILEPPTYGYTREDRFYVPSKRELFSEFAKRMNVFRDRKNWLSFFSWGASFCLVITFIIFLTHNLSFGLLFAGFIYSMVILGSHGTVYLHRYSTHRAFRFKNGVWRFICKNLVLKIVPEEIYVVSHHVHHQFPERAGDPYNVNGGWWYCFLADVNHQPIARNLSAKDYGQLLKLMTHTGVKLNSFSQYQKWGSLCHPFFTVANYVLNWAFWYGMFYLLGGHALATALFGMSFVWAFGVRTFNFEGHGQGKDKRQTGIDFNRDDLSINQIWPGYVAGEWHNNHHLYPNGARSGFLPYQLDLAWAFIRFYYFIGGIESYRDYKSNFLSDYYLPYLAKVRVATGSNSSLVNLKGTPEEVT